MKYPSENHSIRNHSYTITLYKAFRNVQDMIKNMENEFLNQQVLRLHSFEATRPVHDSVE